MDVRLVTAPDYRPSKTRAGEVLLCAWCRAEATHKATYYDPTGLYKAHRYYCHGCATKAVTEDPPRYFDELSGWTETRRARERRRQAAVDKLNRDAQSTWDMP